MPVLPPSPCLHVHTTTSNATPAVPFRRYRRVATIKLGLSAQHGANPLLFVLHYPCKFPSPLAASSPGAALTTLLPHRMARQGVSGQGDLQVAAGWPQQRHIMRP